MSFLEAIRAGRCTRCFVCCYTPVEKGRLVCLGELDGIISWVDVTIGDDAFEYISICSVAGIDAGLPSCIIQEEKPRACADYACWDDPQAVLRFFGRENL